MSAIAGIIHFDDAPASPELIRQMTSTMSGRGPDGINHWVRDHASLGQCMLRSTPESLGETQPWGNEDESLVLVMDGRVDNLEELRRELRECGARLRNRSDAELVLRAYETWGESCPDRIIGEFVFFVWDSRKRELFAARDATGTRHFYYYCDSRRFIIASEINALLSTGWIDQRLNESRLLDYLAVQFDRDDEVGTFYREILRLPAGHALRVSSGKVRTWRYWDPSNLQVNRFQSVEECAEALLDQLRVAVKCRLRSTGPVGAMLSGGLDSSSIVGLIRKEFRDALTEPLHTFSLVRQDREQCQDWQHIKPMLEEGWIQPTILTSDIASDIPESYSDFVKRLNEPFALPGGYTDRLVFTAAREKGCKVVLDGMAGDLLFYHLAHSLREVIEHGLFSRIPEVLAAYRYHGVEGRYRGLFRQVIRAALPQKAQQLYEKMVEKRASTQQAPGQLVSLFHHDVAREYLAMRYSKRRLASEQRQRGNDQQAHAKIFTGGSLSFAHEVDSQIALSLGVEPRSPLSDRRIVEFAIGMPLEMKLAAPRYKFLLRKSMNGILPEAVRWRRAIAGHPGWTFFERHIAEIARSAPDFLSFPLNSLILESWVSTTKVRKQADKYDATGDYVTGYQLYTLAILANWLSERQISTDVWQHGLE
jgi:asparagine synthase (glutamine-hydrolysing)